MDSEIRLVDVAEQQIAVIRDRATMDELPVKIPDFCGRVWAFVQGRKDIRSDGRMIAFYRGMDEDRLNIEVGARVEAAFESDGAVVSSATPAGRAVTMTYTGPYHGLTAAHQRILEWCKQKGYETIRCLSWELYHHPGPDAEPQTDIVYPVKG